MGAWIETNGCRYPADPLAPYAEVMNCRCTLIAALDGVSDEATERFSRLPKGMTYEGWKGVQRTYSNIQAQLNAGEKISAHFMQKALSGLTTLGTESGKTAADYLDLGNMSKRGAKIFDEAVEYVPTKMLKTLKAANVKAVRDLSLERSEYDPAINTISIGKGGDALTVVHEIMHAVERHDMAILNAEQDYFLQRTAGVRKRRLISLTNLRYRRNEYAYDVKPCIDPYAFKDYGGTGYELLSLGVETLYRTPLAYVKDLNMLKWVLQVINM